ncbi:MAG TPA: aminopeptidase [Candidatus Bathyarchaeia archaeon]|nr:aminopeptidase [Candidatus Bathyarchaeia archaeon]
MGSAMQASIAAKNSLKCVFEAKQDESIVIFCDDTKKEIGEAFRKGAQTLQLHAELITLKTNPKKPRTEIPHQILKYLTTQRPQIYLNLLRGSREETPFRIKLIRLETQDRKTRLGHCPGVSLDMLTQGALALSENEHMWMQTFAGKLMQNLRSAEMIEIRNPAGTNLRLSVKERPFFTDTKLDWKLMKWMNLPTGEVIAAPIENSLEGELVCDMAIGGIGPLNTPVEIVIEKGKVKTMNCKNADILGRVQDSLETDAMANVVGEFAFGINPKARFVDEFLECEKMFGTIHIAFGDNTDMPEGKNNSANHMDFMISKPTVNPTTADGLSIPILVDGVFQGI